jgi:hypothetical protein
MKAKSKWCEVGVAKMTLSFVSYTSSNNLPGETAAAEV